MKGTGVLTREGAANLHGIPLERVYDFIEFDAGNAIRFTIEVEQTIFKVIETRNHFISLKEKK